MSSNTPGYHQEDVKEPIILEPEDWSPQEWSILCKLCGNLPVKGTGRMVLHLNRLEYFITQDALEVKNRYTLYPRIEVSLSSQDIDDIMDTALEGSIGYWCDSIDVLSGTEGLPPSRQISRNKSLCLHDLESADCWTLTLEKFLKGVKLYFEEGSHVQVENNIIDVSDIDAVDADIIIQLALFDEVRFS